MSTSALTQFEAALDELGASATHVERDAFGDHVEELLDPPAVGVTLEETLGDDALSLDGTSVSVDPTPVELREATTGVTAATLGIADYGSVVLTPTTRGSELVSLFVDRHVVVVRASDVVDDMKTAVDTLAVEFRETGGSAIVATGPSATADMGELVQGAHGPREVHVVVVEDE
ncbi:LUD domain-containing protein [Halogeometricum limi]|uniref:L-lactate dehydrogenase complex protein LldG n=1 Tax=Halogeometricum limi TaxID=555875 RepID=A0A1I6IFX4_9EURY|nr:LUD domain-containing protein [Halogeometricum limi]SFR65549.1 L-lactate dehydrogenase complex protein LldG [Halogeometricum limi]